MSSHLEIGCYAEKMAMTVRTKKRIFRLAMLALCSTGAVAFFELMDVALRPTAFYSGLLLFGLVLFLALYGVRKRLRFLPVGSSESWLQYHIYIGLFTGVLFGIHVSWHVPSGLFETLLAGLYLLTFLSGVFGLILSRSFAKRLATRGDETLFVRIPAKVKELRMDVESLVMTCLSQTNSSSIPLFYAVRLRSFFDRPRHVFQHVVHSARPRAAILRDIKGFERYVGATERTALEGIASKVIQKDNLDYQYSLQMVLKLWLFVHVPATLALLVFSVIHLLLILAFSGGVG